MGFGRAEIVFLCIFACSLIDNAHSFKPRIIGGRDSEPNEVKYLVAVQSASFLCGGGIIDDKLILTAAHCLQINQKTGTLKQPTKIYVGLNNTRNYDEKSTIIINVTRALVPKDINLPYNDVAILELEESLDLKNNKEKLQKLEFPKALTDTETIAYPSYDDQILTFAAFGQSHLEEKVEANGTISYTTSTSGLLKVASAKVVDFNTCRKKYYGNFVKDSQICIRIIEDEKLANYQGVCVGDSGSTVVLNNKIIVGVASFILNAYPKCNTNIRPAIFSRASSYIEFVQNAMKGNTSNMIIYLNLFV